MTPSRVRLNICGTDYTLSTTDPQDYLVNLAKRLELDLNELMAANPGVSATRAAVLTALDYLDQLEKTNGSTDNMRAQLKNYLEDAASAKMSAEESRREAARLRQENKELKEQLDRALQRIR